MAQNYTVFSWEFPATFGDGGGTSTDTDPVDTVIQLLKDAATFDLWSQPTPDIQHHDQIPISEKGPGDGQPAQVYVWQPTDSTIEQLTADGRFLDTDNTVEVQIWSLDRQEVTEYREDVVDIFGDYLDDQQGISEFLTLPPSASRDYRADKRARRTDHYIQTVEISPRALVNA